MGDTKETNTVAGAGNSVYAYEGGYGPGKELAELDNKNSKPVKADDPELESRQESTATIRGTDFEELEKEADGSR